MEMLAQLSSYSDHSHFYRVRNEDSPAGIVRAKSQRVPCDDPHMRSGNARWCRCTCTSRSYTPESSTRKCLLTGQRGALTSADTWISPCHSSRMQLQPRTVASCVSVSTTGALEDHKPPSLGLTTSTHIVNCSTRLRSTSCRSCLTD